MMHGQTKIEFKKMNFLQFWRNCLQPGNYSVFYEHYV